MIAFIIPFLIYGEVLVRYFAISIAPYSATASGVYVGVGSLTGSLLGALFGYFLYKVIDAGLKGKGTRITVTYRRYI